jgi:hypothetical protein
MYQHLLGLKNRVRRLEEDSRSGEVTFIMPNGTRAGNMHELARSLAAGPFIPVAPPRETDVTSEETIQ